MTAFQELIQHPWVFVWGFAAGVVFCLLLLATIVYMAWSLPPEMEGGGHV